jgi:DNA-3-methyladenine glycosylase I
LKPRRTMMEKKQNKTRCRWAVDPINEIYHDKEWGTPVHQEQKLFEFLTLEGAQAGLSWTTILKKRENYREAFASFDPIKVSKFNSKKVSSLMKNEGIVRNRLKIESTISNAQAFLKIQKEFGSFNKYIWQFVGGKPLLNKRTNSGGWPATSPESDLMSKELKRRGFRFVGSTICYAFMQACGLVNDHAVECFRYPSKDKGSRK